MSAAAVSRRRGCEVVRCRLEAIGPLDLPATLRPLADGGGDPSWDVRADRARRALTTPEGPAALDIVAVPGAVEVTGTGPGAGWAVERVPLMLGLHDDATGFRPQLHPLVGRLAARRPGARFGAGSRVWDSIVPIVLGQRVTVGEARRSWWQLVRRHGTPAPGQPDLYVPPGPAVVARLGIADWHRLGVERGRAEVVRRMVPLLPALDRAAAAGSAELQRVVTTVPGAGPWTATGLAAAVLGDPDVVLLGDLHLPHVVSWALAREPRGGDERMLELLEPWRGHRGRVVRLVRAAGGAPRRGPRYSPLPIARW